MTDTSAVTSAATLINQSQQVIVILPPSPSIDALATAAGLATSLTENGKSIQLVCPEKITSPITKGLAHLETEVGNRNLLISFPYVESQVDKISYHIGETNKRFYLTIKPKSSAKPLDIKAVEFAYAGFEADLLIFVGVKDLDSLAQLYIGYEDEYKNTSSIALCDQPVEFASVVLTLDQRPSLSELAFLLIKASGLTLTGPAGTDLLSGIDSVTDRLRSSSVGADTFMTVAELLQAGASRVWKPSKSVIKKLPKTVWQGK